MSHHAPIDPANAPDLLETLVEAVFVVAGEDLTVRYVNAAAEDLAGLSRRRAVGRPLAGVARFDDDWLAHVTEALRANEPFTAREVELTAQDGTTVHHVDASVTPWPRGDHPDAAVIELVPVDRHLLIAREEALRTQEESNRRLLRGLAHEIRNPLAGLRGAAQLLAESLDDPGLSEYTDVIVREADRLRALVERMVGPVQPPAFEWLNIHSLTEHLVRLLEGEAAPGVSIRTDYDPSIPDLRADADQLIQTLLNLGRNALQALGDRGTVIVRTYTRRRFTLAGVQHRLVACIEIADDGPGIPEALRDSLFQPLVSGRPEGSGLGLPLAQSLARRHGGLIECDSRAGDTVFRLLLPLDGAHE